MSYYYTTTVEMSFDDAVEKTTAELKKQGFGVLTQIDVKATLKKKLDVDFKKYLILGACNPPFAYKALQTEKHIGLMLPCNFVVQELDDGRIEVSAIDPAKSMMAVENPELGKIAGEIQNMIEKIISNL